MIGCLFVGAQCGSKRPALTVPQVRTSPPPAESPEAPQPDAQPERPDPQPPQPQPEPPPLETAPEAEETDSIDALVALSNEDFESGRDLFLEGRREEARRLFRQALDRLAHSGFEFSENPQLEQAYFDLLGETQALEAQGDLDLSQLPVPEALPSPLDEIAEVNLFQIEVDPALEELVSEDLRETRFEIPVVVNREVLKFLDYYQGRGRHIMEEGLRRSGRYIRLFKEIFAEEQVPGDLIFMAHVESLFRPQALSRARAKGIWQFVRGTGKLYGLEAGWWVDERADVEKSTRAAARHLKDLYAEFQDWNLALAAYNAGAGRIRRVLQRHGAMDYWTMTSRRLLPRETRNYVPSILAAIIIFRHPERYGFDVEPAPEIEYDTAPVNFQVDLRVVAEAMGLPVSAILELNPELQRGLTPSEPTEYLLKVPRGSADALRAALEKIPPEKRLRFAHHQVANGETLSQIARRYGVSVRAIAETNRIRNVNRLSLRQNLIIPLSNLGPPPSARKSARATPQPASRKGVHTVRRGETLYWIARANGVTVKDLAAWNSLRPSQTIFPGQKLLLQAPTGRGQTAVGSSRD